MPGEGYSTYYGMQREENSGTGENILWNVYVKDQRCGQREVKEDWGGTSVGK